MASKPHPRPDFLKTRPFHNPGPIFIFRERFNHPFNPVVEERTSCVKNQPLEPFTNISKPIRLRSARIISKGQTGFPASIFRATAAVTNHWYWAVRWEANRGHSPETIAAIRTPVSGTGVADDGCTRNVEEAVSAGRGNGRFPGPHFPVDRPPVK